MILHRPLRVSLLALALVPTLPLACGGGSDEVAEPVASAAGAGGSDAGAGGDAGKGGSAAGKGGNAGTGGVGKGGSAGASGAAGGAGASGAGAAGSAGQGGNAGSSGAAGKAGNAGSAGAAPPPYDVHASDRTGCKFGPGDKTTATIGPQVPHGDALPFKHVVVLMMENRSFDHYFSKLPQFGVTDVDVAAADYANPDPSAGGKMVKRFHETRYCIKDTEHDWEPVHEQWNEGKMDGFLASNNPGGARALGYYTEQDLPFYYWLAKTFTVSDRHFSSLLGPTWPNRFYFYGGTSWGRIHTPDTPPLGKDTILTQLEDQKRSWKIYRDGLVSFALVMGPKYAGTSMSEFAKDVEGDNLPDVSILDPSFNGSGQNDEHPPTNVQLGQKLVHDAVTTLFGTPNVWKKTVLIITYDEHGGYADHVPPPPACVPDDDKPPTHAFDRLGVRVPLMVVSPWAKPGYVSHYVTDHTSVTRFIQNRFDLPALTHRDANAWPMLDFFDLDKISMPVAPQTVPTATPYPDGITWCEKNDPGTGMPLGPAPELGAGPCAVR